MSWLFKQVWVWVLIAFLLGLIITWFLVVRTSSRVRPAGGRADDTLVDEPAMPGGGDTEHEDGGTATVSEETDADAAIAITAAGVAATAGVGVGAAVADAIDQLRENEEDQTTETPGAGAAGSQPQSRDDQPEAAGAAAASAARARRVAVASKTEPAGAVAPAGEAPAAPADQPVAKPVAESAGSTAGPVAAPTVPTSESVAEPDEPVETESAVTDPAVERFGPGAASPTVGGGAPHGYSIKGNADSMLFHTRDSPRYAATRPQVWFKDEESAVSAGFAHWDRSRRGVPTGSHAVRVLPPAVSRPEPEAAEPEPEVSQPEPELEVSQPEPEPEVSQPEPEPEVAEPEPAEPDPITEQFGAGSASPRPDGSAPSPAYTVKGDADTMTYHTADSPAFADVEAEIWFTDEEAALSAGFLHWR